MKSSIKYELHNIISGKSKIRVGAIIQSISNYLGDSTITSPKSEISKQDKDQEAKKFLKFIDDHQLWLSEVDLTKFVSSGAEQRVFLKDSETVFKLNDAIYYSSWKDYFFNLLLHNYFFPDTAYELLGFLKEEDSLYAAVSQTYVSITERTDLRQVKLFMESNKFINVRNNDYFNKELGIILEDLHDENVLTRNGVLYFIDTVFYLTEDFWKS